MFTTYRKIQVIRLHAKTGWKVRRKRPRHGHFMYENTKRKTYDVKEVRMALIILPKKGEPNSELEAKVKLKAAIDEPYTVVMIVSGDSPDIREVLEVCVARASVKPDIRRV